MRPDTTVPATIDASIDNAPAEVQTLLRRIRRTIRGAAPEAIEAIRYRIPTFARGGPLVHWPVFARHIGFYPGASGIARFAGELCRHKNAKGSVQCPPDEPAPFDLIATVVRYRVDENAARTKALRKLEGR